MGEARKRDPADLDFPEDQLQEMGARVLERVVAHIGSLPRQAICGRVGDLDFFRSLSAPAPDEGRALPEILDLLFDEVLPRTFNTAGPGYLAYIPGGGLYPAALADFISAATNRFSGVWQAAPGLAQIEAAALGWVREWMGFPGESRGLLTSGGSQSNLTAILCARDRHLGPYLRRGVLYASEEVHHSIPKAARLAGIWGDRIRTLPVDADFRMRMPELEAAIREDRNRGLEPFMVVSTAGTVNTGAVDPLEEIADLCAREGLWHHVDGAYGAFFHMVPELRPLLRGLSLADSLSLDPHKGLFLPYGTGALLVRDGSALRDTHSASAAYLPGSPRAEEFFDPSQFGPELSRPWRGLRLWLTVQVFGVEKIRAAVAEKRALSLRAAEAVSRIHGLKLFSPPQLSLFPFHVQVNGWPRERENRATRLLLDRVRDRGRYMMSGCEMGERFLGRVCVLSFRTRPPQIAEFLTQLEEETGSVLKEARGSA